MKMLLIFSHQLTDEQIHQARVQWRVTEFVPLPPQLQKQWSDIPPDGDWTDSWVRPFQIWVKTKARTDECLVLVQGEFGATYAMVRWLHKNGYRACYATTKRMVTEQTTIDSSVKINRVFRHIQFRLYRCCDCTDIL